MANTSIATDWAALNPSRVKQLTDARLQVHYAAQFAAAVGISYLTARPDDRPGSFRAVSAMKLSGYQVPPAADGAR